MILKNILTILLNYRISFIKIIFYEIIYLIKGYKGNRTKFLKHNPYRNVNGLHAAEDIPCPYYFLFKIKKILKNKDFKIFLDLGCGSWRIIDFFNKDFPEKDYIGVEYFEDQYEYCKKRFEEHHNIKIIKADFTRINFLEYNADCYFFNNPFNDEEVFTDLINSKAVNNEIIRWGLISSFSPNIIYKTIKDTINKFLSNLK